MELGFAGYRRVEITVYFKYEYSNINLIQQQLCTSGI